MSASDAFFSSEKRGQIGLGALAIVLLVFVAWIAVYATGAFPWLGYAWLTRSSDSVGGFTIGETRAGTSFGIDHFLFVAGQEIVIEYDAEIRAGSLWFHVFRPYDGELGDGISHYVTESSVGTWTTRISETGVYVISIQPSLVRGAGHGWDLGYSVWWGARRAR